MMIVVILIILITLSAFFSATESALISFSKIKLRHLMAKGSKPAHRVYNLITTRLDKFIAAILIGNNIVNIAISGIVTALFLKHFGLKWGPLIAIAVVSFFVLIFCEITPKIFGIQRAERLSLIAAPLVELLIKIFTPLIFVFTKISNSIIRIFGGTPPKRSPLISEEELRLMIELGKEEGVLSDEERKMFHRIFEFGDTAVDAVMAPKEKIVSVDIKATAEELLDILLEQGHSRLPVFDGSPNNIVGVIYANELLHILKNKELIVISDLIHPIYYVPANKRVSELLVEFQAKKIQIAAVVDNNQKAIGLVTLEDLVEEIVGEIEEEKFLV
jgi:CBS domain containing-hemolysin-like protein